MIGQASPAGLRLVGKRLRLSSFVVFVRESDDADEVRVRVDWLPGAWRYRCDSCGASALPRCAHTLAAAQVVRAVR